MKNGHSISWRGAALAVELAVGVALGGPALAQGKVLKFVPEADLRILDPITPTAYVTRNHGYMVYDVLLATEKARDIQIENDLSPMSMNPILIRGNKIWLKIVFSNLLRNAIKYRVRRGHDRHGF